MLELLPATGYQRFPVPPGPIDLTSYPRRGATIAAALHDTRWNVDAWMARLGLTFGGQALTQFNVWGAIWNGVTPHLCWPVQQTVDGRWDLYKKNPLFFRRLRRAVEQANRYGVVPQLCFLELYSFSDRKSVPFDRNLQPLRHNVNGVLFAGDDTWLVQKLAKGIGPEAAWLKWFIEQVVEELRGLVYIVVPFNEGPEKPLHLLIARWVLQADPSVLVCVNRNDDTPGQYQNHDVGDGLIDLLAHHGWKSLAFLTKDFSPKADPTRTPKEIARAAARPWTFNEFFENRYHNGDAAGIDFARVVVSSDGSRASDDPIDTYDYEALEAVMAFCAKKGCNLEHQSRAKMPRMMVNGVWRGWPTGDLASVEWPFLERMEQLAA